MQSRDVMTMDSLSSLIRSDGRNKTGTNLERHVKRSKERKMKERKQNVRWRRRNTVTLKRKGEEAPAPSKPIKGSLTISFSINTGPSQIPD